MSLLKWLGEFESTSSSDLPLEIFFLGEGIGESVVFKIGDLFTAVIDSYGGNQTSVTAELIKILGIQQIDFLQMSHIHSDHYTGLMGILKNFKVKSFGRPALTKLTEIAKAAQIFESKANGHDIVGDRSIWPLLIKVREMSDSDWGENPNAYLELNNSSVVFSKIVNSIEFKVEAIAPLAKMTYKFFDKIKMNLKKLEDKGPSYFGHNISEDFDLDINNSSVVTKITYGKTVVFLTGDTSSEVLRHFKAESLLGPKLRNVSVIIKIPHHGSSTSDFKVLFEDHFGERGKKYAIVAPYVRHRLPETSVIQKYRDAGYTCFQTSVAEGVIPEGERKMRCSLPTGVVKLTALPDGKIDVRI